MLSAQSGCTPGSRSTPERSRAPKSRTQGSAQRDRFAEEPQEERDALLARRLNRIDSRLTVLERELEILAEWQGLYLHMWFATHLEIPLDQRDAALRQAQQRYERFLASLGKRIADGHSIFIELPKELTLKDEDFQAG